MWWEKYIEPVLKKENKENLKYLDISDMLNVFKMNWEDIFKYLDNDYYKFKYDREYMVVNKVHRIRTVIAHANDIDMSIHIFVDYLSGFLDYSRLINTDKELTRKLDIEHMKYWRTLPEKKEEPRKEEKLMEEILSVIENKVLLKAANSDTLPPDIKLSNDRTIRRFYSMRTVEEIVGFFNGAIKSERGQIVQEALHNNGLLSFEDIKDEINAIYNKR